jgi:hypothetical protein
MSARIVFAFARGGRLTATPLRELNPKTAEAFLKMLPLQATVYHSRWSGREINFPVQSGGSIGRENQTTQTITGDVIYWREWEKEGPAAEAIAIYYGPEISRDHRGRLPVNVFARVPEAQWREIERIGLRIWQEGVEKVAVTLEETTGS